MPYPDPLLVLIFGASGSGKTTLMRELQTTSATLTIHRKGTDRLPKKYDSDDLLCLPQVTPDRYQYIYRNYGCSYGIEKKQIDAAFASGHDHFVICNDINTIASLRLDYGDRVRALFLLFDAPREHIERVQKRRGISDDQIDLRLAKIGVLSELFVDNSTLFDGVIVNRLGTPPREMVRQVQAIIGRNYSQSESLSVIDRQVLHDMVDVLQMIQENLKRPYVDETLFNPGTYSSLWL